MAATWPVDDGVFGQWVVGIWKPSGTGARAALLLAIIADLAIFGLGSRWLGIPPLVSFDGSLLLEPSPIAAVAAIALLLALATAVGTVLAGSVRFEAGLFAAALGMIVVSLRSGTVQTVLQQSNGDDHVFVALAAELLILAAVLGALWAALWIAGRAKLVRPVAPEGGAAADTPPASHVTAAAGDSEHPAMKLAATGVQAVVTAIIMMFLCQSQAKYQALASLAIASTVGTIVAYHSFPTRPSVWFWTGPLLVGFFGYILAASGQVGGLAIGNPQGAFAALARPLPVDYASVGTAGAIWGYWTVRKRQPA